MKRLAARRLVEIAGGTLAMAVLLFVPAGRMDWFWAWAYLTAVIGVFAVNAIMFLPRNLELIAERAGAKENTKSWDRTLVKFYAIFYFVPFLIAGLDFRFGWSPQLPLAAHLVALVTVVASYGLASWAMISNKFFSRTVRIQRDRGHTVITTGPYQYVRHPGYVGMIAYTLATPLLLGSFWAMIPSILMACGFIIRTSLEDKTLQEELDGYRDYAQRVKYRLIPRIW